MLRAGIVLVLVGAVGAGFSVGAADAKARPKCTAKGSHTLVRTSKVRVYEVGDPDHTVYGCLLSTGKRKEIASYSSCGCSISDEPAPGIWVNDEALAVNSYGCPPIGIEGDCTGGVASFDLRSRARKFQDGVPQGYVAQLVLRQNGSFAYIANGSVRKADSAGSGELDAGPVEAGSLAHAGSIVYWTRNGAAYSARLQ